MTHPTLESVQMRNKHLFREIENCTAMIKYLSDSGADVSFWASMKARLKMDLERNLEVTFRVMGYEEAKVMSAKFKTYG